MSRKQHKGKDYKKLKSEILKELRDLEKTSKVKIKKETEKV